MCLFHIKSKEFLLLHIAKSDPVLPKTDICRLLLVGESLASNKILPSLMAYTNRVIRKYSMISTLIFPEGISILEYIDTLLSYFWHSIQIQHQQNVFYSLEASRSVWGDVDCKLTCIILRSVSDPWRAFQPVFRVTENSDDWYRSTMGVMVMSLETHQCTGENFGCTWEDSRAPATSMGVLVATLGAPRITVKQSGKNIIRNTTVAPGNHIYYLSFNDC